MVSPCNLEFGKSFILISTVFFVFFLLCCAVLCFVTLAVAVAVAVLLLMLLLLLCLLSLFERFENLGIIYCRGDPYFEGLFFCRKRIYIILSTI